MASKKCVNKKLGISLVIVGGLIFVVSLIILACFPTIYEKVLHDAIKLIEGSMIFDFWRDIPLPIYERIYFFNISNADDFLNNGAKMKVTEVGPYTFEGKWVKENLSWHPNGTITFQERRTYHFRRDLSVGSLDEEVFTLNGPLASVGNMLKDYGSAVKLAASLFFIFKGEKLIIKKSVGQLAYDGYEDDLIKYGKIFEPDLPFDNGIFSWLYGKNDTYDGSFTAFTGENDISKLNVINNWDGEEKLKFWNGSTCNMINGTNAEVGPPLTDDQQEYTFFQSIFCRSLTYHFTEEVSLKGVKARRFEVNKDIFGGPTANDNKSCFKTNTPLLSGVLDVSPCQFGAPAVISLPHFYLADRTYADAIDGMMNNTTDYSSHMDVEPTTGVSIQLKMRFQINVLVSYIKDLFPFYKTPPGLYPVLWVDVDASVDDDLAHMLYHKLNDPKVIVYTVIGLVLALSVFAIVLGIVILVKAKKQTSELDDDPLICPHDNAERSSEPQKKRKISDCNELPKEILQEPSLPYSDEPKQDNTQDDLQTPNVDDDDNLLGRGEKL